MRPIPGQQNKCEFQWILNINLKGWIPQYILDSVLINIMFDYTKHLRQHITKLKGSGRLTC